MTSECHISFNVPPCYVKLITYQSMIHSVQSNWYVQTVYEFYDSLTWDFPEMQNLIFTALLIVLHLVLVGCSNSTSEWIQGTWKLSDDNGTSVFKVNPDGNFAIDFDADIDDDDFFGTYSIDGDQLTLVFKPLFGKKNDKTVTLTIIDKEANSFRLVDLNEDSEPSPFLTRIE